MKKLKAKHKKGITTDMYGPSVYNIYFAPAEVVLYKTNLYKQSVFQIHMLVVIAPTVLYRTFGKSSVQCFAKQNNFWGVSEAL